MEANIGTICVSAEGAQGGMRQPPPPTPHSPPPSSPFSEKKKISMIEGWKGSLGSRLSFDDILYTEVNKTNILEL